MQKVFLWFYCLPIVDAVLLTLLATALFLYLRELLGRSGWWRAGVRLLLAAWIAVILLGTLAHRMEGGNLSDPILAPFASYRAVLSGANRELYRMNFMNTVLFYPAGLLGCEALPRRWRGLWRALLTTALLLLVSAAIEYAQHRFGLGLAETDDVIHNTLGALLGAAAWGIPLRFRKENGNRS